MPASAAVTIDLQANTASASRGLDAFKKQVQGLRAELTASANSFGSRWDMTRKEKRLTLGLGAASIAADFGASVTKSLGGSSATAEAFRGAASGAGRFATMLAPLGPQAALVGAALGGLASAVKSATDAHAESAKQMKKAVQAYRDAAANIVIENRHADTPEKRAEMQRQARERLADLRTRIEMGATVSEGDVAFAARWDRAAAEKALDAHRAQNGGKISDSIRPLADALFFGPEFIEKQAREQEQWNAYGRRGRGFLHHDARVRTDWIEREQAMLALGPDLLKTLRSGSGFDPELDRLAESLAESSASADPKQSRGLNLAALSPGAADSYSSLGVGFTGADPAKKETLDLLRRIADATTRSADKPSTSPLLSA